MRSTFHIMRNNGRTNWDFVSHPVKALISIWMAFSLNFQHDHSFSHEFISIIHMYIQYILRAIYLYLWYISVQSIQKSCNYFPCHILTLNQVVLAGGICVCSNHVVFSYVNKFQNAGYLYSRFLLDFHV